MQAVILLSDYAEELGGKLYIMGGGWSRLYRAAPTTSFAIAVRVEIPWDRANERLPMTLRLATADGPTWVDDEGNEMKIEGQIEVGRPPGIEKGIPLDSTFTLRVSDAALPAGRYTWVLEIDGDESARAAFTVVEGAKPK